MKECPECLTPLTHQNHKIFHCWTCPEGHGTLYPKGELEHILKALAGLGDLEVSLWENRERYTVIESPYRSPDSGVPLQEIRDRDINHIMIYGDPVTHALWLHTGEEEKLLEHLEKQRDSDAVSTYLQLAAKEAAHIFEEDEAAEQHGHLLAALMLLGGRIARAMPFITL